MTIDKAIKHYLDIADGQDKCADISISEHAKDRISKCAADHRQLAEWLTELKELRRLVQPVKHGRWSECYTDSHHYSGICTVCGKASIRSIKENPLEYCPKCGARMDGDTDGI